MGSSSQYLAGALLMIFKTISSVTGSKFSKSFQLKRYQGKHLEFGGGNLFLNVRVFSGK